MKKRGLDKVAKFFSEEANVEMSECKCLFVCFIFDYIFVVNDSFEKNIIDIVPPPL